MQIKELYSPGRAATAHYSERGHTGLMGPSRRIYSLSYLSVTNGCQFVGTNSCTFQVDMPLGLCTLDLILLLHGSVHLVQRVWMMTLIIACSCHHLHLLHRLRHMVLSPSRGTIGAEPVEVSLHNHISSNAGEKKTGSIRGIIISYIGSTKPIMGRVYVSCVWQEE